MKMLKKINKISQHMHMICSDHTNLVQFVV